MSTNIPAANGQLKRAYEPISAITLVENQNAMAIRWQELPFDFRSHHFR
jgi:hypothetical protein